MFNYFFGNKKRTSIRNRGRISKARIIEELVKKLDDKANLEERIENKVTAMISNIMQTGGNRILQEVEQKVNNARASNQNEIELLKQQLRVKELEVERLKNNRDIVDNRSTSLRRFTTCEQLDNETNYTSTLNSSVIHQVFGHTMGLPTEENNIE